MARQSTIYIRYMRLYLKHETTIVTDLSTRLFRIMSLPLLPCSLAQFLLTHSETGTEPYFDRFQHDKHATKTIYYSVWPSFHFSPHRVQSTWKKDSGIYPKRHPSKGNNQQTQQTEPEPNQHPIDHGQTDAGLEASSRFLNAALPSAVYSQRHTITSEFHG